MFHKIFPTSDRNMKNIPWNTISPRAHCYDFPPHPSKPARINTKYLLLIELDVDYISIKPHKRRSSQGRSSPSHMFSVKTTMEPICRRSRCNMLVFIQ